MGEFIQPVPEMRREALDLQAALNQPQRRRPVLPLPVHEDRATSPLDVFGYAKLPKVALPVVL